MRPAYVGEAIAIGGHQVTVVVDVANVMGSRPDGWWRDRAGAAVRLHDEVAGLAAGGHVAPPAEPASPPAASPEPPDPPGFVMVLEGAAKAAARRISPPPQQDADVTGGIAPGEVRVVLAPGSGDDTIVAVARDLPGRRYVVTADRELRRRCVAAGAGILGPGWLLGQLRQASH